MTFKRFLLPIALFVILGVGICAAWEFDNVKTFTPTDTYGKIEIINAFGLGDTLAEYELQENTDHCLTDCMAKGKTTLYEPTSIFENIKTYNKRGEEEAIKDLKVYLKHTQIVNKTITTYPETCEELYSEENDTYYQSCSQIPSYEQDTEELETWLPYNFEEMEVGVYEWKVIGKKDIRKDIDWIGESLGMEFSEWAWWNSSYSYKRKDVVTHTGGGVLTNFTYLANGTTGFDFGGGTNQIVWVKSPTINTTNYIYYNNNSDYDFSNEAEDTGLCYDVEYGNSTNHDTCTWSEMDKRYGFSNSTGINVSNSVSGGSNIITLTNVLARESEDCVFGSCLDFSKQYYASASSPLSTSADSTITFWVKVKEFTADGRRIFGQNTDGSNYIQFFASVGNVTLLTFPTDGNLIATNVGNGWNHYAVILNSSALQLYVNGVLNQSTTSGTTWASQSGASYYGVSADTTANPLNGSMDELRVYSKTLSAEEILREYEMGLSVFGAEEEPVPIISTPSITTTPAYYNTELNCSVNFTGAIDSSYINFTWYRNNTNVATYDTHILVPTNNTVYYTETLVTETLVKNDNWTCSVTGYDGTDIYIDNSTAVTVQDTAPTTPTLQTPPNNTEQDYTQIVFLCNGSTDGDGDNINYEYWGNFTSDAVILQNSTQENYTFVPWENNTFYWKCRANDNETNSSFTDTWNVYLTTAKLSNIIETHIEPSTSGASELYTFNASFENINVDYITAQFFLNGTSKTVNRYNYSTNNTLFNVSLTSAGYDNDVTLNLTWLVTLHLQNGSTEYQPYNYTQVVQVLKITNCLSSNSSLVMNFTLRDEINLTLQNGTFEAFFTVWDENGSINSSLSVPTLTNSSFYLCMTPNNITRTVNAQIEYNGVGYDRRDYFFRSVTLNSSTGGNTSLETVLYLLTDTEAVGTKFVVTDELENPLSEHYIYAQRKDISNNTFFTVAMGKTDSDGEAYIPLDFYDAWYKFVVYDNDNTLIKTTDETILQATPILIKITPSTISDILTNYDNMDLALSFNNATKTFTFTYSDGSGAVRRMCLEVKKLSTTTDNRTVCSECLTTSAGSMSCGVGTGEGRWVAIVYGEQNPSKELLVAYYEYVTDLGDKLGVDGVVYGLLMIISVVFLFIYNPTSAIFATIVTLIFLFMLGFASLPYLAVISIVCAGVVLLVVIRS